MKHGSLEKNSCKDYAGIMVLADRNNLFKAGIIYSSLSVVFIIAASFVVLPVYSFFDTDLVQRSAAGFLQIILNRGLNPSFYAVHVSISALAVYSLAVLCFIFYFFEKTQSPEILFIALFIASLACESLRLFLPLQQVFAIPSFYLLITSRLLLFGRCFGLCSLFAAGIYAVGLEIQKQRNVIGIAAIASFIIALGTPIDTFTWETSFNAISGYAHVFRMINGGILLITVISFLIAAYLRGSREYIFIGVGVFLAFAGRSILLHADSWAGLPGIIPLSFGAWFICKYLHKVYLWL